MDLQSLDYFYLKHNKKRLRFFKNDYVYHYLSARNNLIKWEYLGKDGEKGDAVIISHFQILDRNIQIWKKLLMNVIKKCSCSYRLLLLLNAKVLILILIINQLKL